MITYLAGKIINVGAEQKNSYIEVLVSGGVGYKVYMSNRNIAFVVQKGEDEVKIYTSFQVREDSQILYGFADRKERDFFELLTTVSGVGPKSAMSVLSTYLPEQLIDYIQKGDYDEISKVPGIGKKSAQKIIVELQNETGKLSGGEVDLAPNKQYEEILDTFKEAMKSLGFKGSEMERLVNLAKEYAKNNENIDQQTLITYVLKSSNGKV